MKKILIYMMAIFLIFYSTGASSAEIEVDAIKMSSSQLTERNWNLQLGKWYGNQPSIEGGRFEWLVHSFDDGTYFIDFKITDKNGNIEYRTEYGDWGLTADILFSIYRGDLDGGKLLPAANSGSRDSDVYKFISISNENMEYQDIGGGTVYTAKRVDSKFCLIPKVFHAVSPKKLIARQELQRKYTPAFCAIALEHSLVYYKSAIVKRKAVSKEKLGDHLMDNRLKVSCEKLKSNNIAVSIFYIHDLNNPHNLEIILDKSGTNVLSTRWNK